MISASALRAVSVAVLATGITVSAHAAESDNSLQPFQLVRSLQLVQDKIASGDHAALPMQRKLLELIDARLRDGSAEDFKDPKNFRALLVYAMSGGNPTTMEVTMPRLDLDDANRAIFTGVVNYLRGQPKGAQTALASVDPMTQPSELGAFLALVKGSVIALDEPKAALRLLDQARLLGTGTLVEEAALRRSVALAATLGDARRFMLASTQYVDRYLRSPYASQFADAFVSGVITLHASLDQETLGEITSMMDAEQEKVVYLRIARRAAIEGLNDLSAFASAKAEAGDAKDMGSDDPRALLYASLASVTSANIDDIRAKLKKIDRKQLSESDRMLLDAVGAIADEVTDPPSAANMPDAKPATLASQVDAMPAAEDDHGVDAAAMPEDSPEKTGPAPVEPVVRQVIATNAPALAADSPETPMDPADLLVVETRKKLDAIDRMLGDAKE